MEQLTMFKTFDGELHESQSVAHKHIDKLYGEKLSGIAHKLLRLDSYLSVQTFIDENLGEFVSLQQIKNDKVFLHDEG